MIARGRLDIGWMDLLAGAAYCATPGSRAALERRIEERWSRRDDAFVCLSIRSGLDLLLTALAYPPGSEVLVSAVTIRDMVRVIEGHGLVAVPVDMDMNAGAPRLRSLQRARGPRTRALLMAPLFGSRMPLDEAARFAREHGLLLIEDCAQAFTGLDYTGHPAADVSMFSFGPIKTATALGGAVFRVRDPELRESVRRLQAAWPVQGRGRFLQRVARFFLMRLLMLRLPFTLFCAGCRLLNRSHDDVISHAVRGFSGPDFFANIRHQPSFPLLALLRRRLARFDGRRVERRKEAAQLVARLTHAVARPGREAEDHSYWTFPVESEAPDDLVRHLWSRGFDATRGQWSLFPVPPPASTTHAEAAEATATMRRVVYVPVYPEVARADLVRLADTLCEFVQGPGTVGDRPMASRTAVASSSKL
ncbi:MAG TPA: DegT/DnrJ/EryC1/StrS family aminotransferase [Vicinamibacteria bacterium]|jgi:dTDP-4-amino-4,6-dideoxygalactose transaminase